MPKPPYDIIGQRFGRRTVIRYAGVRKGYGYRSTHRFIVQCDCGRKDIVDGTRLRSGKANQCLECVIDAHRKKEQKP